jgi:hypothetical protein
MRLNHTRGASMGRVADAIPVSLHDVYRNHRDGRRVKVTRRAIHYFRTAPAGVWEQDPKRHKFQGGSTPARGRQPGRILELARPETAGRTPRDLTSRTRATEPESWDFDESEQDFGEKRNPPKPHASP